MKSLFFYGRLKRLQCRAGALLTVLSIASAQTESMTDVFRAPPAVARPHVHWHWMSGNVTAEGITADLESMHRIGVGGVQIYNAAPSIPHGPVDFMSSEWRQLTRFAMQEAARLGLEVGIHNCAGWSSSGGPWVPVEQSMKELTWSETPIEGGKHFEGTLAMPFQRKQFYRDEVLVAVPTPDSEVVQMRDLNPKATSTLPGVDMSKVVDGDLLTVITGPSPSPENPQIITLALDRPLEVQTLNITPGPSFGAHGGFLECSLDGKNYQPVCAFQIPEMGNAQTYLSQGFTPVTGRFFRITFNKSDSRKTPLSIAEIELSPSFRLADWRAKAGFISQPGLKSDRREPSVGRAVKQSRIINLTGKLTGEGRLTWDVPAGHWTLYRFGLTTKDKVNKPYTPDGAGYECDKMSKAALETFWGGMMKAVVSDNADLVGKTFKYVMLDSFEVGSQNYTDGFPALFQQRTGYSMIPYMPALTGAVIESVDVTERFLWDFRRVVADLWKENYFDHLNTLASRSGLKFIGQDYGNGNFDSVEAGTGTAYPMTEFWVNKPRHLWRQMAVSSSAHLSGQSVIFSESFTAHPQDGAWKNSPASVKAVGDLGFVDGANAITFHTYAHQPWVDARPGMTMGPYGIHFNRGNTWWESAGPWMDYLARCQWLLRRGLPVVDLVVFAGENSPVGVSDVFRSPGLHTEFVDRASLQRMTVDQGLLKMPGGMSYRVLVVPDEARGLSLPVVRALKRLVSEGATIVANKPTRTPSLQGYPSSETELRRLADEVWGVGESTGASSRSVGRGKIIAGKYTAATLVDKLRLEPDFALVGEKADHGIEFIHLSDKGTHAYFISNQRDQPFEADASFRVTGLQPEWWDPLTGESRPVMAFETKADYTVIPLALDKAGSVFIVFREPVKTKRHLLPGDLSADLALVSASKGERIDADVIVWKQSQLNYRLSDGSRAHLDAPEPLGPVVFSGPWSVTFEEKGKPPLKQTFDSLSSWSDHRLDSVRYFSGTATYETDFTLSPDVLTTPGWVARLNLGRVEVLAEVRINGHARKILWSEPFTMEVSDVLVPGNNHLEVRVTNNWPNRLIGDQQAGDPRKWAPGGAPAQWPAKLDANQWPDYNAGLHWMTWRHYTKDSPLQPSGLLGPVKIEFGVRRPLSE